MIPTKRSPTHPGEMLLKEFLQPMKISQKKFCQHLNWPYARLNEIIHGRRGVTVRYIKKAPYCSKSVNITLFLILVIITLITLFAR